MKIVAPSAGIEISPMFGVPPLRPEEDGAAERLVRRITGDNGTHVVSYGTEAGISRMRATLPWSAGRETSRRPIRRTSSCRLHSSKRARRFWIRWWTASASRPPAPPVTGTAHDRACRRHQLLRLDRQNAFASFACDGDAARFEEERCRKRCDPVEDRVIDAPAGAFQHFFNAAEIDQPAHRLFARDLQKQVVGLVFDAACHRGCRTGKRCLPPGFDAGRGSCARISPAIGGRTPKGTLHHGVYRTATSSKTLAQRFARRSKTVRGPGDLLQAPRSASHNRSRRTPTARGPPSSI